jgi:YHS domain-containing protein
MITLRALRAVPALLSLLALSAVALFAALPAQAQNTAEPAAALRGMDVVSYFTAGGPVPGVAEHRHDFDGARYLFASAQNKAAFVADPDRWLPQFSGLCANGVSKDIKGSGDPNAWKIVDGKLYLFHSAAVRTKAEADPETLARAHQKWAARK